ncbi:HAMP domain-containing histidine kinase [Arcobacter sp. KX21116]|uniref:sensor histidine kinase n=1 Tax=Arcobacter iocasae TaxID=2906515 RepID=UPI0035D4DD1D
MEQLKKENYLKKFSLLFILTAVSFTILILSFALYEIAKYRDIIYKEKAQHEYSQKKEQINKYYQNYKQLINSIKTNPLFTNYIKNPSKENLRNSTSLFESFVSYDKHITQLRYIDINGEEKIRIDRPNTNGDYKIIENLNLQNKEHRNYFEKSIKLSKNEVYISRIDLNIENKKIEIPYKPVLRFSVPIFEENKKTGILIINIFAEELLDSIKESKDFDITIYDQDKEVLVSNNNLQNEWTRYLKKERIKNTNSIIFEEFLIKSSDYENLFISFSSKNWLNRFLTFFDYKVFLLFALIIFIAFVSAYYLAKIPKKLFDRITSQQEILIQQSKTSAMGEMIAILAHQWRQPLNQISVLIQEIEFKKKLNLLSDEEFETISNKIKNSLSYMSHTINDFRDFLKPSKEKNQFNILDTIKNTLKLIDAKFLNDYVTCEIINNSKNSIKEYDLISYENEFKHVIINILNNSIDALKINTEENNKKITIELFNKKNIIIIKISDNGGGIEDSIKDKIFEPYKSTKEAQQGTGLGLYMSKLIIENNFHGKISAQNLDNKAVFTITLNKDLV